MFKIEDDFFKFLIIVMMLCCIAGAVDSICKVFTPQHSSGEKN